MSITQSAIPASQYELHKFIPRKNYIKNSATINRLVSPIDATTPINGEGMPFTSKDFKFIIDRSQSTINSLNEAYFNIAGLLAFKNNSANPHIIDSSKLSFAPQWLLSMITDFQLVIGGTSYQKKENPINYVNIKTLLSQNFNDIKRHLKDDSLMQCFDDLIVAYKSSAILKTGATIGLSLTADTGAASVVSDDVVNTTTMPGHIKTGAVLTSTILNTTSADIITLSGDITYIQTYCEPDYSLIIPQFVHTIAAGKTLSVPFACKLYLKDLFELPEIPLYDIPAEVSIHFGSKNSQIAVNVCGGGVYSTADTTTNAAALTEYWNATVSEFTRFTLYNVTMTLDNAMRALIAQTYKKKQVIIVNNLDVQQIPLSVVGNGSALNLKIPYEIGFESEFIGIAFPKRTSNEGDGYHRPLISSTNAWDTTKARIFNSRMVNNTNPFAFQYIPINTISILADGVSLWERKYTDDIDNVIAQEAGAITTAGWKPSVNNEIMTSAASTSEYEYFDHQTEYETMKRCRFFLNQLEDGACTYSDFLTKYYCILIPTKHFTNLSTSSNIQVKINFAKTSTLLDYFQLGAGFKIDNFLFINFNRRAIAIENGIARSLEITQSFANEIEVENVVQQ